jgi:hypothetical protein
MSESPVLSATRLQYEYVGPAAKKAKGWAVTDDAGQLVATVPQPTGFSIGIPEYPFVDANGVQLARIVPGEQQSNTHRIVDGAGAEQAHVGTYDGDFQRTDYDVVDATNSTLIHISIGTNSTSITGVTITDASGQQVATIEQRNERISFLKGRTSFVLQRQDGLTDPVRMVVVLAPLLIHLDFELRELRSNTGRVQRDWRPL